MKSSLFVTMCLAGALFQGCVHGSQPGDVDPLDEEEDITEQDPSVEAQPTARQSVDAKIATLNVPGGQIIFVDEGLTEPGGGIGFWEVGGANLSYLLDDENATALEVFLALSPEGTEPPERLVAHHAEISQRMPEVPRSPRRFPAPLTLPEHSSFTNDTLGTDGSATDKDCWGWAGTSNTYSTHYGYQSFDYSEFEDNFNASYSQLSAPGSTSGSGDHQSSQGGVVFGPTAAGHQRALAFCLSKAIPLDSYDLASDCSENLVGAEVSITRTTNSSYTTFVTVDSLMLTAFGQGGRYRSNYTNSGGGARKYAIQVVWSYVPGEGISGICADQIAAVWRSRYTFGGGGVGGVTGG